MEIKNTQIFSELKEMLVRMLGDLSLDDKEHKYRLKLLEKHYKDSTQNQQVSGQFFSICHEIKGLHFLKEISDQYKISHDSRGQSGPDAYIGDSYFELTCLQKGVTHIDELDSEGFIKEEFLKYVDLRLTQALESKLIQFRSNTILNRNSPYVIFISLGDIENFIYKKGYGIEVLRVLLSKDVFFISIDRVSKKQIDSGYKYVDIHYKNNGSQVSRRYFDNKDLSAVIVSHATIDRKYSKDNCILYLNPNAEYPLKADYFEGMIYWNIDEFDNYKVYINNQELEFTTRLI